MEDRQRRNRRQFTAEFKRDAVEQVRTSGRPIAEIARELGIYDSTLGNWVRQDRIDRGEQDGLTSDEQARLRALERENAKPRMERDLAQTNRRLLGHRDVDAVTRYRCVDAQKAAGFPVAAACQAAGVTARPTTPWRPAPPRDRLTATARRPAWSVSSAASTPAPRPPTAHHG
jgi:transposase-like protein